MAQVRELDQRAIAAGISGHTLMLRAAAVCWRELQRRWAAAQNIHVVCGTGNNGGDGYAIASLAAAAGRQVKLWQVGEPPRQGDAALTCEAWIKKGGKLEKFHAQALTGAELVVDALFGSGLTRDVAGDARAAIETMNSGSAPVLAVDVPSGIDADTGTVRGAAVKAAVTVSFIGNKLGLYTGAAVDHVGDLVFDPLEVPASLYASQAPQGMLLDRGDLKSWLPRRARSAHKGAHGHVLVIGGDTGMMGAALLAGRAALRGGAGLVSVATRAEHAGAMAAAQPELMCRRVESERELGQLLARADVIAVGPGLGQGEWGRGVLGSALATQKPMVLDADALNLLVLAPVPRPNGVITPHPGEAARLLGVKTSLVQDDRHSAVRALQQKFEGVAVLKGAGTLIQGQNLSLCPYGNPGMGAGGMGDVLSGIIAAFMSQGLEPETAANAGVLAHALAGDAAARSGERGLLPSDLLFALRAVVNQ